MLAYSETKALYWPQCLRVCGTSTNTLSISTPVLFIHTPLKIFFSFFFKHCLSTMAVNSSPCSSIHPCGQDLLEKATSHWLMLGSITDILREYSHSATTICYFTPQYYLKPKKSGKQLLFLLKVAQGLYKTQNQTCLKLTNQFHLTQGLNLSQVDIILNF